MNQAELKTNVDTIVILMMENRSFDHLFGSLRLPKYGNRTDVDGITDLEADAYVNISPSNEPISPFLAKDGPFVKDIPHDRNSVTTQLDFDQDNTPQMAGFVTAYYRAAGIAGMQYPPPMGILPPDAAPMSAYLAANYTLCDKWFAPIPTSTFPNRLMSLCGDSSSDQTASSIIPNQLTVYQYLESLGVRWRVYHQGLPFLLLMKDVWPFLPTEHFRRFSNLANDFATEPDATRPQVIFIEPDYFDSPVRLSGQPCDDHAPLPMVYGERFLRDAYMALSQSPRWRKTVMIYTFDEHGGFFDHVQPLNIPQAAPAGAQYTPFQTTGPRVPAVVVSPMADKGVRSEHLDHTSILQLLAERFGDPANPITTSVSKRRQAGISSVSALLDAKLSRTNIQPPPAIPAPGPEMEPNQEPMPTDLQEAFASAAMAFADTLGEAEQVFPEVVAWAKKVEQKA
jgi:phospholipase C